LDARYPATLRAFLGADAPPAVTALGDLALLDSRPLAIFCSSRCPGNLIVQASDLAHGLRDRGAAVIGGFHTSVEAACLEILLAGAGPLIVCPARGMYKTIPAELRKPLAAGRLLLLSPFEATERRVTAELAAARNRFVAALAERVLFIHAAPGGRTEALAREVIGWGKPAYALAHVANAHLFALGVRDVAMDAHREWSIQ
jgi:predicted Rossmann fold nucleotide-binding protein DprA/Smf involved in DNA uptake